MLVSRVLIVLMFGLALLGVQSVVDNDERESRLGAVTGEESLDENTNGFYSFDSGDEDEEVEGRELGYKKKKKKYKYKYGKKPHYKKKYKKKKYGKKPHYKKKKKKKGSSSSSSSSSSSDDY